MNLIKHLNKPKTQVSEDGGAVAAGAVAGQAMPLFSALVKRNKQKKSAKKQPVAEVTPAIVQPAKLGLAGAFNKLKEAEEVSASPDMTNAKSANRDFDNTEVIAKLKGLERKETMDSRDVTSFGLEDDNGGIVRVSVPQEQAKDFENALQGLLASNEDENEAPPEIAEVLFKLKDHFDIIDVTWPEIQEDEEQVTELEGGDMPEGEGDLDADMDMPPDDMADTSSTASVQDLLTQVIDMMRADAEARKAEALAREAEAKTKQADAIVAQTMARVKQEEQFLDMETYNKSKKEEEREVKRLAQLAKWKHDMSSGDTDDDMSGPIVPNRSAVPEDEEYASGKSVSRIAKGRIAPHDVAQFIIDRVK